MSTTYRHTPDMGEISGFGGGYEECCQDMLEAGVNHIMTQKLGGEDIALRGFEGVFGLVFPDNKPTEELNNIIRDAAKGEGTGAMTHTVMLRLGFIAKNGWDKYCEELRQRESEEAHLRRDRRRRGVLVQHVSFHPSAPLFCSRGRCGAGL